VRFENVEFHFSDWDAIWQVVGDERLPDLLTPIATWVRNRRARIVVEINDLAVSCLIDRRAARHARIFVSEQQTTSLIRAVDAPPRAGDRRGLR
jgi:uncharacterized Zn-finger protein